MAQTLKFGNGTWATKTGSSMAYNDQNGNYKPLPFNVERDSIATRVNKEGLIEVVGKDKLRIDYTDSAKGVALLENSSTNLITYSQDFSQWGTVNGVVVTDNFATSPDGTQNAAKVVYDGTSLGRIEISTGASGTNTQSIYLKTVSGTQAVSIGSSSSDLTEVTVTSEWQRFTHTGSGNYPRVLCNDATTIFVWGAMLEQLSYATSYIPTFGSTVQRQADVVNGSGNSEVFNDSSGVLFADIAALADDLTFRTIALSNGTTSNNVGFGYRTSSNVIYTFLKADINSSTAVTVSDVTLYNKVAVKYKSGNYAMWINGFEVYTNNTSFSLTGLNELAFDNGGGDADLYGKTKQIGYYDTVLTDAELETLTSYRSLNELVTELNLNTL